MDDRILKLLESPIESDRRRAIDLIADSNDKMLLKPLADAIKRETDPQLREYGMKVISRESGEMIEELFGEMFSQFKQGNFNLGNVFDAVANATVTTINMDGKDVEVKQIDLFGDNKPKREYDPFDSKPKRDGLHSEKPKNLQNRFASIGELLNSFTTVILGGAIIAYLLFTTVAADLQNKIPMFMREGDYPNGAMVGIYSLLLNLQTKNSTHIALVVVGGALFGLLMTLLYTVIIHVIAKSMGGEATFWRGFNRVGQGFFAFLMVSVLLGVFALSEELLHPVATYLVETDMNAATLSTRIMAPGKSLPAMEGYALLVLLIGTVLIGLAVGWIYRLGFLRGIVAQAVVTVILGGIVGVIALPIVVRLLSTPLV